MMRPRLPLSIATLVAAALLPSCSGDQPAAAACASGDPIQGACVGVPSGPVCGGDACTDGVACASVAKAKDDATLSAALAAATAGTCITLAPASYAPVVVPGGVSLLGKGAGVVTVGGLALGAGEGAVVRGMTVGAGGVVLNGAIGSRIESVKIGGSASDGVKLVAGASAIIISSDIYESGRYGVSAFDSGSLTIKSSFIHGSLGPGVWAECSAGCGCAAPASVELTQVKVRDNKMVGVSLVGVKANLSGVEVSANTEAADFRPSGGISISQCATVGATSLRVLDNTAYGMLVDQSTLTLGTRSRGVPNLVA